MVIESLYADDIVLFDSIQNGLRSTFHRFSNACCVAGIKINAMKIIAICLSRQLKQCSLQVAEYH